jgi:hypothetical protein
VPRGEFGWWTAGLSHMQAALASKHQDSGSDFGRPHHPYFFGVDIQKVEK